MTASIAEYKTIGGYSVRLFENRVEVRQKFLGMNVQNQSKDIPIRNITSVEGPTMRPMRHLTIKTNDGQEHTITLYYKQQLEFKRKLNDLL